MPKGQVKATSIYLKTPTSNLIKHLQQDNGDR